MKKSSAAPDLNAVPALYLDERALDLARASRDARFDGRFFIAVTSTRIYCRPVCPAPSPKRANVRYYATAAAAAEAGFRPCLRCRPEAAPGTPAWQGTSTIVKRALRLIDDGALDQGSIQALAERVGVGARQLDRLFAQHVGASPLTVAHTRRLQFAKRLIDDTQLPLTQVALAAGFRSVRRFNAAFLTTYKRAPRELRRARKPSRATSSSEAVVLKLAFRPPYNWTQVRDFLATRAIPGVEHVTDSGYARTIRSGKGHAIVRVRPLPDASALELRVIGADPGDLFDISARARRMFDVACDPDQIAAAFASDRLLRSIAKRTPGLRIPGAWDPFECAVRAVLGQQVTVAAGRTLAARVVERLGDRLGERLGELIATDEAQLTRLFPSPEALATADLSGLGITTRRAATLTALARAVADGDIDFDAPVSDVVTALINIPGIGPWTAHYVALRALGDPDAFMPGDLVLRQVVSKMATPVNARELESRAEQWRPWRGYAVIHLWRASND